MDNYIYDDFPQKGSYITGLVGAVIFGLIGTIPWIIVGQLDWFVSFLGYLIGLAAIKGYELFNGRNGFAKVVIIICTAVLCVIFAQMVDDIISLIGFLKDEGLDGLSIFEILTFYYKYVLTSKEYILESLPNLGMGLLFAGMGIIRLIQSMARQ